MDVIQVSAPAKIILFGEHSVVYGHPAIAIPVSDIRAYTELQIDNKIQHPTIYLKDYGKQFYYHDKVSPEEINHIIHAFDCVQSKTGIMIPQNGWQLKIWSEIPIARGMGSSAAVSVALLKVMLQFLKINLAQSEFIDLSYELEKFHHGRPSGIDNTVISLEKPIFFQKEKEIQYIEPAKFYFVIGDTGIGKKTSQVVNEVANRYTENSDMYGKIFKSIGDIAVHGLDVLQSGDTQRLGELMNENQSLLSEIGVSSPELDNLINVARKNGAIGAKLCGAGKGGCMVALVNSKQEGEFVSNKLIEGGAKRSFLTVLKSGK
jgi:mevalonate kinase